MQTRSKVRTRWWRSEREILPDLPHGGGVSEMVSYGTGDHLVGHDLAAV
ncbi:MAG TPA: hypothetical protein VMV23_00480 [Candidatus Nanopelagicaceae bacterium]|nr:hypothetical protein [Candidatus Nanopelagicaceae bacterium]